MNVLLIGHACGPGMGSEPGGTWNWAQHLSLEHRVVVITHPQFQLAVDAWMNQHPNPNLTFVWVDVESVWDPWRPSKGEKGIRVHYLMWLKRAYAKAEILCREEPIDVAHHVSWGTLRAAPPLWRLPVPAVWGPLGGGQTAPVAFLRYFGWRFWNEILRLLSAQVLRISLTFRKAARTAAVVFATNKETSNLLKSVSGARVENLLDCALPSDWMLKDAPGKRDSAELSLVWVGRLEHRKALLLGLHALASVKVPVRLRVAGAGPLRQELEASAERLGISKKVEFLGSVPYREMRALLQSSDALLFTSLRDSFGSVVLEAMAQGLPVITLNHQGVGAFVPEDAGIKVHVDAPSRTIQALAEAIEKFGSSPALRRSMQLAAWNFAKRQTWDHRAKYMTGVYEEVVALHRFQPILPEAPYPMKRTSF